MRKTERAARRRAVPCLMVLETRCVPTLLAPRLFATGNRPFSAASGDFNEDGALDIVTGHIQQANVSVLLGVGDGTFTPYLVFPTGGSNTVVRTGDLTGDGHLDIVSANKDTDNVTLLRGNGDGTFGPPVSKMVGDFPNDLEIGDLNGDGALDVITANRSHTMSVLLNRGAGDFKAVTNYSVGEIGYKIAIADYDGDGALDAAVATNAPNTLAVLRGKGDGTFHPGKFNSLGNGVEALIAADLNADNKPDLAAGSFGDKMDILIGNGDGTFAAAVKYQVAGSPIDIAAADINGDGNIDLINANNSTAYYFSVLPGVGDGTFSTALKYGGGGNGVSIVVEDFNGDAFLDVVIGMDGVVQGQISVSINRGDATFVAPTILSLRQDPSKYAITADVNSDGDLDVITANVDRNTVSVLLGNGDATLQQKTVYPGGPAPVRIVAGQFNDDLTLDLMIVSFDAKTISVLLGNGDGNFQSGGSFNGAAPRSNSIANADLDGDGFLDVVTVGDSGGMGVLRGNGDGTFASIGLFTIPTSGTSILLVHVNADEHWDAVIGHGDEYMSILLGNGDGTFHAPTTTHVKCGVGKAADLDGDSDLDLVGVNHSGLICIMNNLGNFTFAPAVLMTPPTVPLSSLAIGNVNGDAIPDIVTSGGVGSGVFLGRGNGSFRPAVAFATGHLSYNVTVGDLNGDHFDEVIVSLWNAFLSIAVNDGAWSAPCVGCAAVKPTFTDNLIPFRTFVTLGDGACSKRLPIDRPATWEPPIQTSDVLRAARKKTVRGLTNGFDGGGRFDLLFFRVEVPTDVVVHAEPTRVIRWYED